MYQNETIFTDANENFVKIGDYKPLGGQQQWGIPNV
jgi:hypothetical protein